MAVALQARGDGAVAARARVAALRGRPGMLIKEARDDLVCVDIRHLRPIDVAVKLVRRARPCVPASVGLVEHHIGPVKAVGVPPDEDSNGFGHRPPGLPASVELRPFDDRVLPGCLPCRVKARVRDDRVLDAMERQDRHRQRRVVGQGVAHATHCRDGCEGFCKLRGQPRAEARAVGEAHTPDAVHVDADFTGHLLEDLPHVLDVFRHPRKVQGVLFALQHNVGEVPVLCEFA
mmetsp:Transcript_23715/g.73872  ORF Transcript_23715/g.73872 Transcript_23715/m.73872 type:complete len:233 (+) Transcript_23715:142-840(+)